MFAIILNIGQKSRKRMQKEWPRRVCLGENWRICLVKDGATPGELKFEWLDEIIDILGTAGLSVVLGTPTATPPRWMLKSIQICLRSIKRVGQENLDQGDTIASAMKVIEMSVFVLLRSWQKDMEKPSCGSMANRQ